MHEVVRRFLNLELTKGDTPTGVCRALREAVDTWLQDQESVSTPAFGDAPPWLLLETRVWNMGEALRRTLTIDRAWRESDDVLSLVRWVLRTPELGKGRQPFLELGARYDLDANVDLIVSLLEDPEVCGQAIKALRTRKVTAHANAVMQAVGPDSPAWVKREAKKYLALARCCCHTLSASVDPRNSGR